MGYPTSMTCQPCRVQFDYRSPQAMHRSWVNHSRGKTHRKNNLSWVPRDQPMRYVRGDR